MKITQRNVIATCVAAAAIAGVTSTALALSMRAAEPMYITEYYTDASKTVRAGITIDRCPNGYIVTQPAGVTPTPYFDREWIGMCPGYLF